MNDHRILGLILIAAAIIGILLSFSLTKDYYGSAGLIWNLSNRNTFRITRTVQCSYRGTPVPPCPSLRPFETTTVQREIFSVQLGIAVTVFVALGLVGVGVLITGRRQL